MRRAGDSFMNGLPQCVIDTLLRARGGSPFYKRLLAGIPEYPTTESFETIRPTTRHQLENDTVAFRVDGVAPVRITSTGGTTSAPLYLLRSKSELRQAENAIVELYELAGIRKGSLIALLLPFGLWNIGHLCMTAAELGGYVSLPIGTALSTEAALKVIQQHRPQVIFTHPGLALGIDKLCQTRSVDPASLEIQVQLWAGEPFSEAQRLLIERRWRSRVHSVYGAEELDALGIECPHRDGLHLLEGNFYEIADSAACRSVRPGEVGRLLVTTTSKELMPLIRYDVGDLAEWVGTPCPCGHTSPRIRLHGRANEGLILAGATKLYPQHIDSLIADLPIPPVASQVQLSDGERGEVLTLCLDFGELNDEVSPQQSALAKKVADELSRTIDLGDQILSGHLTIGVKIMRVDEMIVTAKGKLRRLVDLRAADKNLS